MAKRYRALVPLYYPGAPGVARKILGGENVPMHQRDERTIGPGEWADDLVKLVPAASVRLYVSKGLLEEVETPAEGGE